MDKALSSFSELSRDYLSSRSSQNYFSSLRRFLCYLEEHRLSWSQLVPDSGDDCPLALEYVVNVGIRDHDITTETRAALNHAFKLNLRGAADIGPTLDEHTALMSGLRRLKLRPVDCVRIRVFLTYLELQGSWWSRLVPRPAALEEAVNVGIRDHGLHADTRAALNQAFKLNLRGAPPDVAHEHTAPMDRLSPELSRRYRSHIRRLLSYLEQQNLSWSRLVPTNSGRCPTGGRRVHWRPWS